METIYFKGTPCHTYGSLPQVGSEAPCFHLTSINLEQITCETFKGKRIVLNIFPSLDTDVCARSVRKFNVEAAKLDNVAVVCVSMDLPLHGKILHNQQYRKCHTRLGIPLSAFRSEIRCAVM